MGWLWGYSWMIVVALELERRSEHVERTIPSMIMGQYGQRVYWEISIMLI